MYSAEYTLTQEEVYKKQALFFIFLKGIIRLIAKNLTTQFTQRTLPIYRATMSDYKPTEHGGLKKDGTPDKRVGTGGSSSLHHP
jgi:hypothetical protein